jgi:hypothetical protein
MQIFSSKSKSSSQVKKRTNDHLVISDEERRAWRIALKSGRTGHGLERSLLLMKLARLSAERGLDMFEVGVFRGGTAQLMMDSTYTTELPHSIILFDTFSGHPAGSVTDLHDGKQREGQFGENSFDEVFNFLRRIYQKRRRVSRVVLVSADALKIDTSKFVGERQIGLCHIDTDLYRPTIKVLDELAVHIAPNGFFLIDDYLGGRTPGVALAVEEFLKKNSEFALIPCIANQALLIRNNQGGKDSITRDKVNFEYLQMSEKGIVKVREISAP